MHRYLLYRLRGKQTLKVDLGIQLYAIVFKRIDILCTRRRSRFRLNNIISESLTCLGSFLAAIKNIDLAIDDKICEDLNPPGKEITPE